MNSIIWRGVSSTTIKGLLICELPPITKPEMRIKETVIDGREGSIIEELGYSAYEKTIVIGLHGAFDINKVIKYFTGEGDIIFSNEPDKVYRAKICGKIDYTRLLRFRQASITFKVQPFKYKFNEFFRETQTATASGTEIVVGDSAYANFKAFKIYGKSTQAGTPTPDEPVELVSAGTDGGVYVSVTGANLLPYPYTNGTSAVNNGITYTVNLDGTVLVNGTATEHSAFNLMTTTAGMRFAQGWISVSSGIGMNKNVSIQADVYVDGNYVGTVQSADENSSKRLFTTPFNVLRVGLMVAKGTTVDNVLLKPMVCSTETTPPYEPYKVKEFTITTPNGLRGIPVASGGNYTDASGQMWCADEIDLERGVHIQRCRKATFDGTEKWDYENKDKYFILLHSVFGSANIGTPFCSHFVKGTTNESGHFFGGNVGFGFYHTSANVNEWKNFLSQQMTSGTPVELVCSLATPIETPLTAEQIAMCKALKSNEPSTTILNDENAYMSVEYIKPFEVFNEGLEDSKPLMVLKGSGTVEISVNGTHTFTYTFPEGENEVYIDSEKEDAYLGGVLKNRNMNGEFPILIPKTNIISWSGDVESIEILPRSRWL